MGKFFGGSLSYAPAECALLSTLPCLCSNQAAARSLISLSLPTWQVSGQPVFKAVLCALPPQPHIMRPGNRRGETINVQPTRYRRPERPDEDNPDDRPEDILKT